MDSNGYCYGYIEERNVGKSRMANLEARRGDGPLVLVFFEFGFDCP